MFKRLKNWILSPAEDHAVATFAWFGLSYLALGTATIFPALAPIAVGTAALASKIGILEGIITGAHIVTDVFSWGVNKIFGRKSKRAIPARIKPTEPDGTLEKSKEKEHQPQNAQENPKADTKENPQPMKDPVMPIPAKPAPVADTPVPAKPEPIAGMPIQQPVSTPMPTNGMPVQPNQQNINQSQLIQFASMRLMAMMKQIKSIEMEIKRIQMENKALSAEIQRIRQENLALTAENQYLRQQCKQNNRRNGRRSNPRKRLVIHRHYICDGQPMHE